MNKVILKGFIIVPTADLSAVKKALISHKELTRNEPGCLMFNVTQSEVNLNRFDVYEEFINKAAFDQHQVRVKNSAWGKAAANVKRHYEILE
ncbi:Arginase/agmatinase/formimionoglutamate hydrolase [Moritella sp. JT01]|uniref:putative quinol monooxygenase n=1 Tax=Moritella sp. JT01 TaxID=756698 RepID=UPI000795FC47|nr:antibiotic biosynthesis monooxygenase [Moritella sp. JT01]KXO14288.1 Arginase/agmatinase/formimionoglutamate hydrolase [Moritella sp. JT01]